MDFSIDFVSALAAFLVAVGILVTVHEFGHFWVARRFGVRVLRFSVGFGRPIWSRRGADGTEYVIGAIPLGGYVKMLDGGEQELSEDQLPHAFNHQSIGVRSAIVLAGPAFNFLFAAAAWWVMFMVGVAGLRAVVGDVESGSLAERAGLRSGHAVVAVEQRETLTWNRVVEAVLREAISDDTVEIRWETTDGAAGVGDLDLRRVPLDELTGGKFFDTAGMTPAMPSSAPLIGEVLRGEAAERAGMRSGDRILRANGRPIDTWSQWVEFVRTHPEVEIPVEVERNGEVVSLMVRPAARESAGETVGRIGAGLHRDAQSQAKWYVAERATPWNAAALAVERTWAITSLTASLFWKMLRLELSSEHLSGPVTIARYARDSARLGMDRFIEFLAIVSVSLGLINLLPIPVLDGGHLLFQIVEFVKGRPLSTRAMLLGHQAGIVMIFGLMGLALYNDMVSLMSLVSFFG